MHIRTYKSLTYWTHGSVCIIKEKVKYRIFGTQL